MSSEEQQPAPAPEAEMPPVADGANDTAVPRRDPLVWVVVGLVAMGLLMICLFGMLLLGSGEGVLAGLNPFAEGEEDGGGSTAITTTVPTPAGEQVAVEVDISNAQPVSLTLDAPTSIEIGTDRYPVSAVYQPFDVEAVTAGESTAVWLYGTIINYVFVLNGNESNRLLLERLAQGDPMNIRTKEGKLYEFIFTGRELRDAADSTLLVQNRPSVTLILQGEANEAGQELVVFGDYVVSEEAAGEPIAGNTAVCELGETCQLGNTRLSVTGATHAVDRPEAPPGFALYFIDYSLENIGNSALDTGLLRFVLVDELGNQYSLNSLASQLGNNPMLGGVVEPQGVRQVTAGYQIPQNLASENLRWVVSRVDNPSQVEVVIPFASDTDETAQISLQQAQVSPDGTSLMVVGQVTNVGSQPIVVNEGDVLLQGEGTSYFVFATTPSFPWTVPPGQAIAFSLSFQRPTSSTAVFQLLNQSFELRGLR